MPLHRVEERVREIRFERLDRTVGGTRGDEQPRRGGADRLVVQRVRLRRLDAEQRPQRARRERHGMRRVAMALDVLEQRPAERDVGHLQAAADPQERDAARARRAHERDLVRVARGVGRVDALVARPAVARRVDVEAAADEDGVQTREILVDARGIVLQRFGACAVAPEGGDVGVGLVDDLAVGPAVARVRDADERRARP